MAIVIAPTARYRRRRPTSPARSAPTPALTRAKRAHLTPKAHLCPLPAAGGTRAQPAHAIPAAGGPPHPDGPPRRTVLASWTTLAPMQGLGVIGGCLLAALLLLNCGRSSAAIRRTLRRAVARVATPTSVPVGRPTAAATRLAASPRSRPTRAFTPPAISTFASTAAAKPSASTSISSRRYGQRNFSPGHCDRGRGERPPRSASWWKISRTAAARRSSGVLSAYGDGFRVPNGTSSTVIVSRRATALKARAASSSSELTRSLYHSRRASPRQRERA